MATGKKKAKNAENYTETFFKGVDALAEEKKLDREVVLECLEDAIASGYEMNEQDAASYGLKDQKEAKGRKYAVEIDRVTGEIFVSTVKEVVLEVVSPNNQISLEEARQYDPEFVVGDEMYTDVTPTSFEKMGRSTSSKIKSLFIQKILDSERRDIEAKCKDLSNEIVSCEVELVEESQYFDVKANKYKRRRRVFATHDNIEFVMNEGDLLPGDNFKNPAITGKKEIFKALVLPPESEEERMRRERGRNKNRDKDKNKSITPRLSRTSDMFLRRLLESEVASIRDGRVVIKDVARKPGQRSKVAVYSNDPNIDPVSACVGPGGQIITAVSDELRGEKIDVILWSPNLAEFVANALSPAKANFYPIVVEDDYEKAERNGNAEYSEKIGKVARVVLKSDQLTLAIGAKGINVALAAALCKCRIDIKGDSDENSDSRRDREFISDMMNNQL
ncbi:MAG: transcription termination/antitermination protein NusA [Clostridia bacterium]|nr:transcription termination/antitermination protein NusA [Clostridia bacterium]